MVSEIYLGYPIHHHFVPKREKNNMENVSDRKTIMDEKSH